MSKTVIQTNVGANARSNNVLANTRFQFADQPGDNGLVAVRLAVTSDVAGNEFELTIDKDFVALEDAIPSTSPAIDNENPGEVMLVTPGSQVIIDLINNNGAAQDFHTTVEFSPA